MALTRNQHSLQYIFIYSILSVGRLQNPWAWAPNKQQGQGKTPLLTGGNLEQAHVRDRPERRDFFLFYALLLLRLAALLAEALLVLEAFLATLLRLLGAFLRRFDVFLAALRFLPLRPLAFLGLRRDFFPTRLLPLAPFLGLRRDFFPARLFPARLFLRASSGLLLLLKHAEAPTPEVRTRAPFLINVFMAVLTRALFLATSYP